MPASVSQNGRFRAVLLSVIMILMTQVGYTENMDFSIGLDQDTESKDTGSSTPALTPSVEGADLMVGDLMNDITFQTISGGYNGNNTSSALTTGGSVFNQYSPMGNYVYFEHNDGVHGQELWKTDGTTAGTSMVVDFNNGSGNGVGGNKGAHYVHGNTLYYQCNDGNGTSSTKFCKTDGTASGTVILHSNLDISEHNTNHNWAHIGNTVYFLADDGTHGKELWKTDGTANGTVLVKDINVGAADITGYNSLLQMVAFQNHIYLFSSYHPSNPPAYMNSTSGGLWKSDGTTSGTVFFMPGEMKQLSVIANKLFFRCLCGNAFGSTGVSIVASDGTYSGSTHFDALTHATYDWEFMHTGDEYEPRRVKAELNGYAFYGGDDSNGYLQLYKTDGTANGSSKVTNFSNGTELREVSPYCKCVYGQVIGNTLYFQVDDVTTGIELWKTDGTTSGTKIVKDINVGSGDAFPQFFTDYHAIGDTLFFPADDGIHGFELWRTNGTASGTMMVEDLNPSGNSANSWILNAGTSVIYVGSNGSAHVRSYDPANIGGVSSSFTGANCTVAPALPTGLSMDSSTCTISGTPSVATSNTTYTVTANISGTTYQGTVWLATVTFGTITSPVMGAELDLGEAMTPITLNYTSQAGNATVYNGNGTAWMVTNGQRQGNELYYLHVFDDMLLLAADLNSSEQELWKSDGTEAGTVLVKDINPNGPSDPVFFTTMGDYVYFRANDGTGEELWKTDGTASGTVKVKDINSGHSGNIGYGSRPTLMTVVNDTLYFRADDGTHGAELWKTDGTAAGTVMVKDINPNGNAGINSLVGFNGMLYFGANDGINGTELWKSDGTEAGTVMVKDIGYTYYGGSGFSSDPMYLTVFGDAFYFVAETEEAGKAQGRELWKSDGTEAGTVQVADINNASSDSDPQSFTIVGDTLYFSAKTGSHGRELWKTDGTEAGTVMVKDIKSGTGNGQPMRMTAVGDTLYFAAFDQGAYGPDQLWKSDGTEAGTVKVKVICPVSSSCPYGAQPDELAAFGNTLFFSARNGTHGRELWMSDGTEAGTVMVEDFNNGSVYNGHSSPNELVIMDNILYFFAYVTPVSGINYGSQLMAYNPANVVLNTPPAVSWETHPELPEGMSISNGVISGTPSVYAVNQTYTIYANQSGETTTFGMYFSVDTNNPHTVVENQPIDPIGFHGPFQNGTTTWTVSPALPADLVMDPNTGEITGSVNGVLANTTYTVTATHSDGATETFTFSLQSLADFDGDGLPNDLPSDYDAAKGPTPGLVADTDDDADGLEDVVETNTSIYVDSNNTGSNPLDPDTDDDGICDGPNAVPPICIAGPDSAPNGDSGPPIWIGLFNKEGAAIGPYKPLPGGTYEIMPDLPQSLTMDPNTGVISGTPTQTLENTTFTVWVNLTDGTSLSWNFSIEILADSDGDGLPDELPDDYDPSNPTAPGLVEDLDDDNDGISDLEEGDGLDSTNPDTDGDGMCDGSVPVTGVCDAGPDAFPLDPSADTDTDGDGLPDTITGNSTSIPALSEDMDDDGDGLEDISETGTGTYVDESDTGTDSLNPDTDYDGICDGPNAVPPICEAGPDPTPVGEPAEGTIYKLEFISVGSLTPANTTLDATYEVHPDLPDGMLLDPVTGIIYGTPTELLEETTFTVYGNSTTDSVTFSFTLAILKDTDSDGMPDDLPANHDGNSELVEDLDDDDDGLLDLVETGTGVYNGTTDYGTDAKNPDTDGDGICDGPNSVWPICVNGHDSNPFGTHDSRNIVLVENVEIDTPIQPPNQVSGAVWEISPTLPAGLILDSSNGAISGTATVVSDNTTYTLWANVSDFGRSDSVAISVMATFGLTVLEDSDGDGLPNELPADYDSSVGTLIEDDDDDNDGLLDTDEATIGTDPLNPDTDGDGICDGPIAPASGVCEAGADAFPLDPYASKDTDGDGMPDTLTGVSTSDPPLVEDLDDDNDGVDDEQESECDTDPLDAESVPVLDADGNCKESTSSKDSDDGSFSYIWCAPCLLILLLLLLMPLLMGRDRLLGVMLVGPEPENTTSEPEFVSGVGTQEDPFVLAPVEGLKPGESVSSSEVITITNMTIDEVDMMDFNQEINGDRFTMFESNFDENGRRIIKVDEDGEITINLLFDDAIGEPTYEGGEFTGLLKLGRASVYLSWTVNINPDKKKLKEIEKQRKADEKATKKVEEEAKKKAEEEAAAAALLAEEEEKAAKKAEKAEAKKKAEAEAKKKAKKDAAAAALLAKEEEEKAAKEAEEAEAKKKAEAEAKKKAKKPASAKEAKKQEELQRVKERAKSIDFKIIGKASSSKLKNEVKKGAKTLEVANASEFADSGSAQLTDEGGSSVISWTGKDGNTLTGVSGVKRVYGAASIVVVKDDLQVIKGVGPFIEDKLNALGITTYRQIANMNAKLEKQVNEAIEFFPGRVKRDQWVAQAKILLGEDVKIDEKALKKAEDLERVAKKAEKIDFATIGIASASDKDNLQEMKGIGPFIEEKLNALGIFKFEQIAKMTSDIEEEVNVAIEFFPGRVKRDEWVKQAKKLAKK